MISQAAAVRARLCATNRFLPGAAVLPFTASGSVFKLRAMVQLKLTTQDERYLKALDSAFHRDRAEVKHVAGHAAVNGAAGVAEQQEPAVSMAAYEFMCGLHRQAELDFDSTDKKRLRAEQLAETMTGRANELESFNTRCAHYIVFLFGVGLVGWVLYFVNR